MKQEVVAVRPELFEKYSVQMKTELAEPEGKSRCRCEENEPERLCW